MEKIGRQCAPDTTLAAREPHICYRRRAQRVGSQHPGVERLRYSITFRNLTGY